MKSPLTESENVELVGKYASGEIGARWKSSFDVDVGRVFLDIPEIEYWRCGDTGLYWYYPADAAGGAELYTQLERFDWYYMPDKWEFEAALQVLSKDDKILEVGAGFGHFLDKCRDKGFSCAGLELNYSAAEKARARGFQIYEIGLDALAEERRGDEFDVICSFQVLEHLADPRSFLEGMLKNLRVGGRLILSVPNGKVMRSIDPKNQEILNQPPHHMSHWDASVFHSLGEHLPVRLRSVRREPLAKYHLNWIVIGYCRAFFSVLGEQANRFIFNKVTLFPICLSLRLGLRKWIPGHTLLVELEKVA